MNPNKLRDQHYDYTHSVSQDIYFPHQQFPS